MAHTICRLDPEQEQQLIEGLLHADDAAWRRFHELYDRLIYRCIRKVTRSFPKLLDRDDEHEIFSNLLLALLSNDRRKLRCFDPQRGSRLSTWLGLLATHAAYDYLRALRREVPRVPLEQAAGTRWLGDSPLVQVERDQQRRLAGRLIARLSDKDRQFVSLYFGQGLEPERIADTMRISVKTVYTKKHKIQSRLEGYAALTHVRSGAASGSAGGVRRPRGTAPVGRWERRPGAREVGRRCQGAARPLGCPPGARGSVVGVSVASKRP